MDIYFHYLKEKYKMKESTENSGSKDSSMKNRVMKAARNIMEISKYPMEKPAVRNIRLDVKELTNKKKEKTIKLNSTATRTRNHNL